MSGINLKNLVLEGRSLTNHILPTGVEQIERGIEQIEAQTKRLLRRSSTRQDSPNKKQNVDNRTAYLLASRGIDADKVLENLVDIKLGLTFDPLQGLPDTDIDGYLVNEHENLVSIAIEESKNKTISDFEQNFEKLVQKDWNKQKRKIMEDLGHQVATHPDYESSMIQLTLVIDGSNRFASGMALDTTTGLSDHPRLRAYANVVKEINQHRLTESPYLPTTYFKKVANEARLQDSNQQKFIVGSWNLLESMLGIRKGKVSYVAGHFSELYTQSTRDSVDPAFIKFRTNLVDGGRYWLEETFKNWLTSQVRDQHYEIGGRPTVHSEVEAFLKIKFFRNGRWSLPWLDLSIGKTPFWAHVYYLVRMGLRKDALDYIERYSSEIGASQDPNFHTYFRAWCQSPDGRLPKSHRDKLIGEWNSRVRDYLVDSKSTPKGDVFKYTLYKLIGRCELNIKTIRNQDLISTTDDYLWIHTMLINENYVNDAAFEKYTLRDFSQTMLKFGKAYFKKIEIWFTVLLLCGEYEKAIDELSKEPYFAADALHFAVAMAYYGVLNVPENPKSIPVSGTLISTLKLKISNVEYEVNYLHFAKLMNVFAKDWIQSDPIDALHYVYLIGLFGKPLDSAVPPNQNKQLWESGKEYTRYTYSIIKELITNASKTPKLLGEMHSDGHGRTAGTIEKHRKLIHLESDQEFLDRIVLPAAEQCDLEGRYKDALEMYNLCGQPNKVIELLIRKIGETILSGDVPSTIHTSENTLFGNISNPVATAEGILAFYYSRPQQASMLDLRITNTCKTLINLAKFKHLYDQKEFKSALKLFYELDLIPSSNDITLVRNKANSFSALDDNIAKVLPNLLLSVTNALSQTYHQIKQSKTTDKEKMLVDIKERFKAVISYCGFLQYQFPGDLLATINRTWVMLE
ncbi:hypothetical protein HK103_002737 [Boothiomyces macroporosus]|uniref:Nuclear pore protein n=1 Tax=Boothiomyces macroporosus TaxID=261099 RepID=A0AAD5UMK1_9FUNG|nr:hypothetical protein HK103_002737 [Boothiomyces macroporosus]